VKMGSARRIILLLAFIAGLALGLLYTWVIEPVELVNTYPALMRSDYRRDWIRLAALSYLADADLERARARLQGMDRQYIAGELDALLEERTTAGRPASELRRLTVLAQTLGVPLPARWSYLHTLLPSPTPMPATPTPTSTPTRLMTVPASRTPSVTSTSTPPAPTQPASPLASPTPVTIAMTPLHTPTPTPTPPLISRLRPVEQTLICEQGLPPHIEVVVQDERGRGVSGVEVWLLWPGGADRAVSGLKPWKGAGYVDFNAGWDVPYSIGVGKLGLPLVNNLKLKPCPTGEGQPPLIGSWHILLKPQ